MPKMGKFDPITSRSGGVEDEVAVPRTTVSPEDLIPGVERYVRELLNRFLPEHFRFHCYEHTLEVVRWATTIGRRSGLNADQLSLLILAAWFHDTGFTEGCTNHEDASAELAAAYLSRQGLGANQIAEVCDLIRSTRIQHVSENLSECVLHDADICHIGKKKKFFSHAKRLRSEWEHLRGRPYSDVEWNQLQIKFLETASFETEYARDRYSERQAKNLRVVRELHPKLIARESVETIE